MGRRRGQLGQHVEADYCDRAAGQAVHRRGLRAEGRRRRPSLLERAEGHRRRHKGRERDGGLRVVCAVHHRALRRVDPLRRRQALHHRHSGRFGRFHKIRQRGGRDGVPGVQPVGCEPQPALLLGSLGQAGGSSLLGRTLHAERRLAHLAGGGRSADHHVLGVQPQRKLLRHEGADRGALLYRGLRHSVVQEDWRHNHRARTVETVHRYPARRHTPLRNTLRVAGPVHTLPRRHHIPQGGTRLLAAGL